MFVKDLAFVHIQKFLVLISSFKLLRVGKDTRYDFRLLEFAKISLFFPLQVPLCLPFPIQVSVLGASVPVTQLSFPTFIPYLAHSCAKSYPFTSDVHILLFHSNVARLKYIT